MTRRLLVLLVGATAVVLAGCGDDDETSTEEYCEVVRELNDADEPTDEDLDRYAEAAPDEIADEAELAVEAIQERGEAAFEDPEVLDAIEDIETFEAEECGLGDDEGDDDEGEDVPDDTTDATTDETTDDTADEDDDTTTTTATDESVTTAATTP